MKKKIQSLALFRFLKKNRKGGRAISYQQRMEAYRRKEAVMTDTMLLMYARNLNK